MSIATRGSLYPDLTELPGIVVPDDATIETLKNADTLYSHSDYAEQYLTSEHFKVTVRGSRRLFLAHFNKAVTSEHVEAVAKEMGYEVALVEDLLCVGAHPEQHLSIVALGSSAVLHSYRCVPCLDWWRERSLCLLLYDDEWPGDWRFLFVGKNKPLDA